MTDKKATKPAVKAAPKAKAFTIIKDQKDLNKAIASIGNRSQKLDADIHQAAVSVVWHSATHNDPDVAKRLLAALGKTMRKQAMLAWLCNYGAFSTNEAGELVYVKERAAQAVSEANIEAATAEPFWDFAPEPKYVQFDLEKAIAALLKKAESALAKTEQDSALVQPDKLAALRALAGIADVNAAAQAASHTPT